MSVFKPVYIFVEVGNASGTVLVYRKQTLNVFIFMTLIVEVLAGVSEVAQVHTKLLINSARGRSCLLLADAPSSCTLDALVVHALPLGICGGDAQSVAEELVTVDGVIQIGFKSIQIPIDLLFEQNVT